MQDLIPLPDRALPLLAASSASSTYPQYDSGASSLPPRYHHRSENGIKVILIQTEEEQCKI